MSNLNPSRWSSNVFLCLDASRDGDGCCVTAPLLANLSSVTSVLGALELRGGECN